MTYGHDTNPVYFTIGMFVGLLLIVGAFLSVYQAPVKAWPENPGPPHPKPIYNICSDSNNEDGCTTWVSVFDDSGNKCYVVTIYNNTQPAISCVKETK